MSQPGSIRSAGADSPESIPSPAELAWREAYRAWWAHLYTDQEHAYRMLHADALRKVPRAERWGMWERFLADRDSRTDGRTGDVPLHGQDV